MNMHNVTFIMRWHIIIIAHFGRVHKKRTKTHTHTNIKIVAEQQQTE